MKKKIVGIFVFMLMIAINLQAIGTINKNIEEEHALQNLNGVEWKLTIDRGEFDNIWHVNQTDDGEYICCGLTEESDMFYAYLIKVKSDGSVNWSVVNYNLNASIVSEPLVYIDASYVIPTGGGYLVTGMSEIYMPEIMGWAPTGFLWKTDSTGTTEWVKHYYDNENSSLNFFYCVLETESIDGYVVGGIKGYYDEYGQQIHWDGTLMKTNLDGNLSWQQSYGTDGNEQLSCLCLTDEGGYLLTGFDRDNLALWMVKTDGDGVEEWNNTFDGPDDERTYHGECFQTSDGGYIFCGWTKSYGAGGYDVWVIKTDSLGNMDWDKTYGDIRDDKVSGMCKTSDGKYVIPICKNFGYSGGTKEDIWLVKVTEDGYTEWSYLVEEEDSQIPAGIRQTLDGGFIIAGRTGLMGNSLSNGILYKVSAIENQRPSAPNIDGPNKGKPGISYDFTFNAVDPDNDQVKYIIDWGDGKNETTTMNPSGTDIKVSHSWDKSGTYIIKAKAQDSNGLIGPESTKSLIIPRNKALAINSLLMKILEYFPLLEKNIKFPIDLYLFFFFYIK